MASRLLYTTYVEKEMRFLKIWGQPNRGEPDVSIDNMMLEKKKDFDAGIDILPPNEIRMGLVCCAKRTDNMYYRAMILNTEMKEQGKVKVFCVDYGYKFDVEISNIRSMVSLPGNMIMKPRLAEEFILANVAFKTGEVNSDFIIADLSLDILFDNLTYQVNGQVGRTPLIAISTHNGDSVAEILIAEELMRPINTPLQKSILREHFDAQTPRSKHLLPAAVYTTSPLSDFCRSSVYVHKIIDGPRDFAVHLTIRRQEFFSLMLALNEMDLCSLHDFPHRGSYCLVRSSDDDTVCRGVVTDIIDNNFQVFFVDHGTTEIRSLRHLYYIPRTYITPKVMATQFSLSGLENCILSSAMKETFNELVMDKELSLCVAASSSAGKLSCHLWNEDHEFVLHRVLNASLLGYPEITTLQPQDARYKTEVRFLQSWSKFYVHLLSNKAQLKCMMDDLQNADMTPASLNTLKEGSPCIALHPSEGRFHRAEVLKVGRSEVLVKYVDIGQELSIRFADVKQPLVEFMIKLRPQAIECCMLENWDNVCKEVILGKCIEMRVRKIEGLRHFVDLIDVNQVDIECLLAEGLPENDLAMRSPENCSNSDDTSEDDISFDNSHNNPSEEM